jgi:hypothetical protein
MIAGGKWFKKLMKSAGTGEAEQSDIDHID